MKQNKNPIYLAGIFILTSIAVGFAVAKSLGSVNLSESLGSRQHPSLARGFSGKRETYQLAPGGVVTTSFGVTIAAPGQAINRPVDVWIQIEDPSNLIPVEFEDSRVVGEIFFRIGSTKTVYARNLNSFLLGFPIPAQTNIVRENLAIVFLASPGYTSIERPLPSPYWDVVSTVYDAQTQCLFVELSILAPEGFVFTLVEAPWLRGTGLIRNKLDPKAPKCTPRS